MRVNIEIRPNNNPDFYGKGECILEVEYKNSRLQLHGKLQMAMNQISAKMLKKYLTELIECHELELEDDFYIPLIERICNSVYGTILVYDPSETKGEYWYIEFGEIYY